MQERPLTRAERAADHVSGFVGSWRFIAIQTSVILCWITLNVVALSLRWDPYPFVLLNLLFSTQAAYAAPILQLSGNRQTNKIEDLVEVTHKAVSELVRSDALQEQSARNDTQVLAGLLELVQAANVTEDQNRQTLRALGVAGDERRDLIEAVKATLDRVAEITDRDIALGERIEDMVRQLRAAVLGGLGVAGVVKDAVLEVQRIAAESKSRHEENAEMIRVLVGRNRRILDAALEAASDETRGDSQS